MQIINTKNQIIIILIILTMCATVSIYMFSISLINWFSLFLLIVYIRGIIVLFIFVVSLAPNEKTNLKPNDKKKIIMWISTIFLASKTSISLENIKINSSIQTRTTLMIIVVFLIFIIAYLPPKIVNAIYKGIKSTK